MNEEPKQTSEFEEALRESFAADTAQIGDVIEGTIAAIHGDVALVDISGKSEAVLARDELDDLGTGDPVEVVVVSVGGSSLADHTTTPRACSTSAAVVGTLQV